MLPAVTLVKVADVRYMPPPVPSVALFMRNVHPAVSVTVAVSTIIPPPDGAMLVVKLHVLDKGTSVMVQTPPPMTEATLLVNMRSAPKVHVLVASAHTPPPLPPVALLVMNVADASDSVLPSEAMAPPLAPAMFDVNVVVFIVTIVAPFVPSPKTAPPCEAVAMFSSKLPLYTMMELASRLTPPPVVAAVFIVNVVPVPSNELDMIPYTPPPAMLVAAFFKKTQPALSVTAAPSIVMPPPICAVLMVKLQLVDRVTSVSVHTPPPEL